MCRQSALGGERLDQDPGASRGRRRAGPVPRQSRITGYGVAPWAARAAGKRDEGAASRIERTKDAKQRRDDGDPVMRHAP